MFQTIQGRKVYVVELKKFPPPLPILAGDEVVLIPYANALTKAIEQGMITEPGKYAIEVNPRLMWWNVFRVNE